MRSKHWFFTMVAALLALWAVEGHPALAVYFGLLCMIYCADAICESMYEDEDDDEPEVQ